VPKYASEEALLEDVIKEKEKLDELLGKMHRGKMA